VKRADTIIVAGVGLAVTAFTWAGMMLMLGEIRFLPDSYLSPVEWLAGLAFFNAGPAITLWGLWRWRKSTPVAERVE
jgi:hypothetical protein